MTRFFTAVSILFMTTNSHAASGLTPLEWIRRCTAPAKNGHLVLDVNRYDAGLQRGLSIKDAEAQAYVPDFEDKSEDCLELRDLLIRGGTNI